MRMILNDLTSRPEFATYLTQGSREHPPLANDPQTDQPSADSVHKDQQSQ